MTVYCSRSSEATFRLAVVESNELKTQKNSTGSKSGEVERSKQNAPRSRDAINNREPARVKGGGKAAGLKDAPMHWCGAEVSLGLT